MLKQAKLQRLGGLMNRKLGAFAMAIALFLSGCRENDVDDIRSVAYEALSEAQKANRAIDDGMTSGTTMGTEVEEAKAEAAQAKEAAEQAKEAAAQALNKVDELESRVEVICQRAPSACY